MASHTAPERRRFHTAPARSVRKRDVPAVWDLFALDDRANQDRADQDDDASSVASLSHAASIASLDSDFTQQSDGLPPHVDRGGSWPRVRKQRTSEMGSSMSLFEVAEAFDINDAEAGLASLAQLVAEEEAEQLSAAPQEGSNVSIESFVDAVFHGIPPSGSASSAAAKAASASASSSTSGTPHQHAAPLVDAPPALSLPAAAPASKKGRAARERALLEALRQDEANYATVAHTSAAIGAGMGAAPSGAGARVSACASPTFAACVGGLAGAYDMSMEPMVGRDDGRNDSEDSIEADDVLAMLNMDLPATPGGQAAASHAPAFSGGPEYPNYSYDPSTGGYADAGQPSPTSEFARQHAFPDTGAPAFADMAHDDAPAGYPPYAPAGEHDRRMPPHHGYHGREPSHGSDHARGSPYELDPSSHAYHDPYAAAAHGTYKLSPEQLASQVANALDFPHNPHDDASRAPTVRAPNPAGRGGRGQHRPPPPNFMPPAHGPPMHRAAYPPDAYHQYHPAHHHPHGPPPHGPPHGGPPHGPPGAHMPPHAGQYEMSPLQTMNLDAEALSRIPTASIQPLAPPSAHHHMGPHSMAAAHPMNPTPHHGHGGHPPIRPEHSAAWPGGAGGGAPPGQPVGTPMASGATSRNLAERKEWSVSEDNIIRESVVTYGCRWRKIAARLPGRSDDAVRNRWNRLKEMGIGESATPSASGGVEGGATDAAASVQVVDGEMGCASSSSSGPNVPIPLPEGLVAMPAAQVASKPKASPAAASSTGEGGVKGEGAAKGDKERPERISWSKAEDETILRGVAELGHKWNRIAQLLPGRTDHAIRNRFHRLQSLLEDRQRQQQRTLAPNMPLPLPMALPMPSGMSGQVPLGGAPHSLLTAGVDGMTGVITPQSAEGGGYETPVGQGETTSPANIKVGGA